MFPSRLTLRTLFEHSPRPTEQLMGVLRMGLSDRSMQVNSWGEVNLIHKSYGFVLVGECVQSTEGYSKYRVW